VQEEYDNVKLELTEYLDEILESELFPENERWVSIYKSFSAKLVSSFSDKSNFSLHLNALHEFGYFFAPRIGSFSEDAPAELIAKSAKLHVAIENLSRIIWRAEGNETFNIPADKLFKVGDYVNLVNGTLMSISFNGRKVFADFVERHSYVVMEIVKNDISNMPCYLIQFEQDRTVARHSALVRIVT
jgi:hypothetical protein